MNAADNKYLRIKFARQTFFSIGLLSNSDVILFMRHFPYVLFIHFRFVSLRTQQTNEKKKVREKDNKKSGSEEIAKRSLHRKLNLSATKAKVEFSSAVQRPPDSPVATLLMQSR